MDERLRETLSSMMDDEADELSVRRLLSHGNQEDVRGQWQRWQQIRDLMHEQHGPADGIDVAGAVREALDGHARSEQARSPVATPPFSRSTAPAPRSPRIRSCPGSGLMGFLTTCRLIWNKLQWSMDIVGSKCFLK